MGSRASPIHGGVAGDDAVLKTTVLEPGVLLIALNRPQARNALSRALIAALHAAIDDAGREKEVACVILAANGPVFSSGHDLKELNTHRADADGGRAFFGDTMHACSAMMQAIVACPKPVIAAVTGTATAAGCQLVATCDLAVAADTAHFATPGVNIGLFCSTPMVALSRNVARKQAMEMLLLGEMISAADAARFGLVNRVVAQADVLVEALGMARIIAAKSKATVAIGKRAFYDQLEVPLTQAYAQASETMVRNMMIADAEEGICAFLAKRPPQWKDG
jgi:enoyl-CoA hydratase/carnithine racemase